PGSGPLHRELYWRRKVMPHSAVGAVEACRVVDRRRDRLAPLQLNVALYENGVTMALAGILGTGVALPEKVITNADLEKLVDTSDQWITERTGIKERRQAGSNETTSSLSIEAARKALDMAGLTALQLDVIMCSTISPDMPLPSTAAFIQRGLGAPACCAFDLAAACSGFLFGMTVAEQFIKTGKAKYVLVVGAELLSRYLDFRDRATCVIFGDGVAAAVLGPA